MAKKISVYGLQLACALVFSYVEFLIPLDFIAPGIKLGLANAVVIILLIGRDFKSALLVNLCRVALSALLFGSAVSLLYSLAGALVSMAIMVTLKKSGVFGVAGISVMGGIAHNTAQCVAARIMIGSLGVYYYLPFLLLSGAICGALVGAAGGTLLKNKNIINLLKI